MIFSNLKVLLAQRNISISKMSADTNISRTTLTALCTNKSTGIQFDTLDTICSYLNVLPSDVILFSPYSVELSKDNYELTAKVINLLNNRIFTVALLPEFDNNVIWFNHDTNQETKFNDLKAVISQLPPYYISYLDEQIKQLYSDSGDTINAFSIATNLY